MPETALEVDFMQYGPLRDDVSQERCRIIEFPPKAKGPPPVGQALPPANSIQWFATLKAGLAEAQRTGKPILLVSAAPHCAGVSGIW